VSEAGHDWFYPYYRDRALCFAGGMTPLENALESVGAEADPTRMAARCLRMGHKELNIVSQSSPTGHNSCRRGLAEAGYRVKLIKN